jgi:hypothetical protein
VSNLETQRIENEGTAPTKYITGQGFNTTGRSPIPKYRSPNTVKSEAPVHRIKDTPAIKELDFTNKRKKKLMHVWNVKAHNNTINGIHLTSNG